MSVFEEACYLSNQRWIASFPAEFEAIEFSKQHEKRMRILFDKMRRDKYHRFTKRATIALIAAIFIISMTITAFAIPASRDYIIHKFFDHSTYTVVNGEQHEVGEITIGYIPDGFEKTYEYIGGYEKAFNYESQDHLKWFDLKVTSLDHNTVYDTEYSSQQIVTYNGNNYIHYVNESENTYIWNNSKLIFIINGNLDSIELLNIANSVV